MRDDAKPDFPKMKKTKTLKGVKTCGSSPNTASTPLSAPGKAMAATANPSILIG